MSETLMLRAMTAAAFGGRPLAWETCSALLDRLLPGRDVVAALCESGFLACMLRTHVAPTRLFLHQAAADAPGAPDGAALGDTRMVLGADDREPWPGVVLPWPASNAPREVRRRRADTLYADSHEPGLLVLGGADQPAILSGASRLLAKHRPMLLLDFSDIEAAARPALWEACVQACASHGYVWHDPLLMPCAGAGDRLAVLAALGHAAAVGLPAEAAHGDALPDGVAELLPPGDRAVAMLAWHAAPGTVPHHQAVREGHAMRIDAAVPAQGLYPPEADAKGGVWRWTGPGPCSVLMLPIPGRGPWRLRLAVVNWGAARGPGGLRAIVGGAFLPVEHQGEDFICYAPLAPPAFWCGAPLRVELTTPRPPRASPQDPRCLGVCLSSATVSPL
jgi:hypothetical protein